ncbi:phosphotransferase [Streptomyces fodineus]|uniref:phosphotransferase n=1 Tax=Streptomyces fodineus TaxID=1904616 RepID=UPI001D0561B7
MFYKLGIPEDALVRLAERVPEMTRRPYRLLHGDLHRGNLVMTAGGAPSVVVVDWELATFGDPLHDLATHLVRMRYPDHQWAEVVDAWAQAMHRVRPAAVAGLARDLGHYIAFERAQSVYPDIMRATRALGESFDQRTLDRATEWVDRALEAGAEPLRLRRVPNRAEIERILFRWGASAQHRSGPAVHAIGWTPDRRVPEHPDFPHSAVDAALQMEGVVPGGQVVRGDRHVNSVLWVPGTCFPVVVRRELPADPRRERGFLGELAVLGVIERSGVPVAAPRVLATGHSHATNPAHLYRGDWFAIHTYEGSGALGREPDHPVHGLRPHEADALVDQLAALTAVDWTPIDPLAGRSDFYLWLVDQLAALVDGLPGETRRMARFLGLPEATRLREILAMHRVTTRAPALLHGDLNPRSLVRRDDGRLSIVDWDRAMIGDPLYDLVRHMHLTPTRPEIRDRMFRRWETRLPRRHTRDWQTDWQVYRFFEIVRSAYVDLDLLVTGPGPEDPDVRRAVDSYAGTLAAAAASLGLPLRPRGAPRPARAMA